MNLMNIALDTHPVLKCAQDLRASLAAVADLDPTFMPTGEKRAALLEMTSVIAAAAELQVRPLAAGHGGDATTVMVTIPLADLRSELGTAALGGMDSDARISAADVRRLACSAHIIPAVLGSKSQVLDLGRSQRLFSPPSARRCGPGTPPVRSTAAMSPRRGATLTMRIHGHGGRTDMKNALLLCGHHHRRIHDPRYLASRAGAKAQLTLRR